MLEKLSEESGLHPGIKRTLRELNRAAGEIDRQLENPPVSPMSYTEQISILRFLRNQCCLYGADLIGNDLTEEEKIKLCHKLVKF